MFKIYRCPACRGYIDTARLNGTLQRHGLFSASFTCPCCSVRLRPSVAVYLLLMVFMAIGVGHLISDQDLISYSVIPLSVMLLLFRCGRGFRVVD